MNQKLVDAIANMDEESALQITKELLAAGTAPLNILSDCSSAMEIVGARFEKGEYFIPELILSGEIMKGISALVRPLMTGGEVKDTRQRPKVVLGTVKGDIHDIGKDIVGFMLDVGGFSVTDLGVDVPIEVFIDNIKTVQPQVVALSGFLTLSYASMKETIDAIKAAGLRDNIKIMIGGGTVDQQVCEYAGADAFGKDAMAAVQLARQWTNGASAK